MQQPTMSMQRLFAHFGSLRTTLMLLAVLALAVLVQPAWAPLALVFGALSINLGAALVRHPALRRQLPLLVAHLALLALLGGVVASRLWSLDGRFELTEGEYFDGTLLDRDAGPWHVEQLRSLAFRHNGFEIDYAAGRRRGPTRNEVSWRDAEGIERRTVIGDHRPLVLGGHRFYTSSNKGFAPVLRWSPDAGAAVRGAVHLPSFPMNELRQSREWSLPDGRAVWVQLHTAESLIDPAGPARFERPREHRLVVRVGEQRAELAPAASMRLPGGTLTYEGLRTWMGYRVAYDPTLPWLLSAALLSALAMAWHYACRLAARLPDNAERRYPWEAADVA